LAATGASPLVSTLLGMALIYVGLVAVLLARRRRWSTRTAALTNWLDDRDTRP
jgi:hypothetical protein